MRYSECTIAWNPGTDEIDVIPWPDMGTRADRYLMAVGANFRHVRQASPDQQKALLFIDFNTVVVRDNVPVAAAHEAFLKIDEYRWSISPDQHGASSEEDERA